MSLIIFSNPFSMNLKIILSLWTPSSPELARSPRMIWQSYSWSFIISSWVILTVTSYLLCFLSGSLLSIKTAKTYGSPEHSLTKYFVDFWRAAQLKLPVSEFWRAVLMVLIKCLRSNFYFLKRLKSNWMPCIEMNWLAFSKTKLQAWMAPKILTMASSYSSLSIFWALNVFRMSKIYSSPLIGSVSTNLDL